MSLSRQLELNAIMYRHIRHDDRKPRWRGVRVVKLPTDLLLYEQVIWANKPKWIIETGTRFGGSALFFQDMLNIVGEGGKVITIDINYQVEQTSDDITYITGNSVDDTVMQQVKRQIKDDSVMVVLDSSHVYRHVKRELYLYSPLVTTGQYLVVEDCYTHSANLCSPGKARDWFLSSEYGKTFSQTNLDRRFIVGVCLGGWLRRK